MRCFLGKINLSPASEISCLYLTMVPPITAVKPRAAAVYRRFFFSSEDIHSYYSIYFKNFSTYFCTERKFLSRRQKNFEPTSGKEEGHLGNVLIASLRGCNDT